MKRGLVRKQLDPKKEKELKKYAYIATAIFIIFVILQLFFPFIKQMYLPAPKAEKATLQNTNPQTSPTSNKQMNINTTNPNIDQKTSEAKTEPKIEKTSKLNEADLNKVFDEIEKDKNLGALKQGDSNIKITKAEVILFMNAGNKESITVNMTTNDSDSLLQTKDYLFDKFPESFREELKEQLADNLTASLNQYLQSLLNSTEIKKITLNEGSMDIVYF
jgi:hypothetical protein